MNMVPVAPRTPHIHISVDRDADMQRFHDAVRNRMLNTADLNALFQQTNLLLQEQTYPDEQQEHWYILCRRCGESLGQNALRTWQMHSCGELRVTLCVGPQNRIAPAHVALYHLKRTARRLGIVGAYWLWELVSEHVIELFLQYDDHADIDMGALLRHGLIAPRPLQAHPQRESNIRLIAAEKEAFAHWE